MMRMPSEPVRAYIYRVLVTGQPLLTAYGIMAEQTVALWAALASAVLGLGLAAANTSTGR